MQFLVYMYYTHAGYQTSGFGQNCVYYIQQTKYPCYLAENMSTTK